MRTTRLTAAMVAAAVVSGTLALASPASADPTPAGTFRQLVGVGSDTTQDVLNALAGDIVNGKSYADTAVKAGDAGIASYDAFVPGAATSTIQTRSGGPTFLRPNGSGPGRAALSMSLTGDKFPNATGVAVKGQVDFARSSGGPSTSGNTLTYIPFARDAVGVAVRGSALDTLTVDQLHDIYTSGDTRLKVLKGETLHAVLPQAGSGTRKFFLAAIGLTETTVSSEIPTVQENQANAALTEDGALVPFSVGSWIAQNNGIAPDYSKTAVAAGAHLASVQLPGDTGDTNPVTTVNGKLTPVAGYFENATFGRDVYNVVPSRAIDPSSVFFDKALYDVFVTSGTHEAALATDTAEKVIADFGFLNESYNGSVNPAKHAKLGGLEVSGIDTATPSAPALRVTPGDANLKLTWGAPTPAPALPVTDYRVTLTGSDGAVVAVKDVPATTLTYSFTGLANGTYTASVSAANLNGSGNAASWTGAVKYTSAVKATAATTAYGKTPKVAVTVTGSHGVVPSGKVTVRDGAATLGTGTLDGSGKVTIGLSNHLKVATHTLTVSYGGSTKLNASVTTAKLTITKATPSVSSTAPASISHTGRAKVGVRVTATGTTPTGTVRVYEGSRVIATGTLSGGKVTITLPKLSRGKHTLHVFYAGSTTVNSKNGANFTIKST
ncbi:Ig-like domain repeat protein [Streptomyces mirabilis]|uniref:Ig-like domain repeat protein n=1 Tax=Streptomyces mirabilis TaxID=68239 RepID=UPI002256BD8E|nr:Ig-like domain repeat protein [Streptomyces mirabilis]MCX5351517.1 Ig-like domain repeat protein [Streptomyces mirabilis]